jgi:hypothetical protein
MYGRYVASGSEQLSLTYYVCSPSYTGDVDAFSLGGLQTLRASAGAECSAQCKSNCTACTTRCCNPTCDDKCFQSCCFSCFASCNGLSRAVQSARIDILRLSSAEFAGGPEAIRRRVFPAEGGDVCPDGGCTTLVPPSAMRSSDNMCRWTTFNTSLSDFTNNYIAVSFVELWSCLCACLCVVFLS